MSKIKNLTLTELTKYLNKNYKKKSGETFTTGDVQGYIRREYLPKYMGGNEIKTDTSIPGVKLYIII